jgi:anaerobic magnesium-protoporphyrin IX monomethyl ester cyclase
MRIVLLCPDFGEEYSKYPWLGVAYLAAVLREQGYATRIIDAARYRSYGDFVRDLRATAPDVLGVSALSVHYDKALHAARLARECLPNLVVVFGGAHATVLPEETVRNPEVDYVVVGEGELRFLQLIMTLESQTDVGQVQGIAYKRGNQVIRTAEADEIRDLDKLPFPARDLLPMQRYLRQAPTLPLPYPATSIISSRGCRGNCNYCQPTLRKLFGKGIRYRSPANVVDEMVLLQQEYKVRGIFFADDEPTWERDWMLALCDQIQRRGLKVKWICTSRVDTIDREMLLAMKAAGCIQLSFGVESGSQTILNYYRKGVKVARIHEAFNLCKEVGIIARMNVMIGAPVDTLATVSETVALIREIRPDFISVAPTTPTVGTDLFFDARQRNLLRKESLSGYDRRDISTMHRTLSDREMKLAIKEVIKTYQRGILAIASSPGQFWKRKYLFYHIMMHWLTMLSNPGLLVRDMLYYFRYADKERLDAGNGAGRLAKSELAD